MTSEAFQKLYNKLNPKQKEAVDAIDGPVMVIAGPGTGKTQILTLRIANILRATDTDADSILALTFTESGAYSMRKRLVEIIGSAAYKVTISTFHGFCNDIIKNYPEEFPEILSSTNVSDIDQIRLIEEIIEATDLKKLKPYGDTFYYVRPILSQIRDLKREDVDPVVRSRSPADPPSVLGSSSAAGGDGAPVADAGDFHRFRHSLRLDVLRRNS